jgi:hypothetical protein
MECDKMAYAKFAGFEIPKIYDVQESKVHVGETARTAGGKLRRDSVAVKRKWAIKCRPMPKSQVDPLLSHLKSTLYAAGAFWLHEFGAESNSILAMVNPESFDSKTVLWNKDWRELSLTIEEV